MLRHERLGLPVPHYPDGREAIGWIPGGQRPANARLYDACCAKDVNGKLTLAPGMLPPAANALDPATGKPKGPTEGLFRVVLDRDSLLAFPGHKAGDVVYAATISIPKDAAAPFWIDYIRVSVREILRRGIDGLWCDNYSPWDNFAQFDRAFGNWSGYRFRGFLADRLTSDQRREMGIGDPASFQIRNYLKQKAAQFGARDPSNLRDPVWTDPRWADDPVWNAYKVFKQHVGQEALRSFYRTVKDEACKAGRPDFLVAGNDIPLYGLGWVRDEYLDMVSFELMASSYLSTGPRDYGPASGQIRGRLSRSPGTPKGALRDGLVLPHGLIRQVPGSAGAGQSTDVRGVRQPYLPEVWRYAGTSRHAGKRGLVERLRDEGRTAIWPASGRGQRRHRVLSG